MTTALQQRPTKREIDKRLKDAEVAILEQRIGFANYAKVDGELEALNIGPVNELWSLILFLLEEIKLEDYAGGRPPQRSYEPEIANLELWAFAWESLALKKRMYLKFALKEGYFYYVSLHESKKPSRKVKNELFKVR